jgi:hypothetical protein
MKKTLLTISSSALLIALIACNDVRDTVPPVVLDDNAQAEANLQKAREAEADKYAPALYGAAVEALEKGVETESAEILAARALEETIRVRAEAKEAAHQAIRSATVLCTVVEAILRHDPPRREAFPSDSRLNELKDELARARAAYEAGDFAVAGVTAQNVASELSTPGYGRVRT